MDSQIPEITIEEFKEKDIELQANYTDYIPSEIVLYLEVGYRKALLKKGNQISKSGFYVLRLRDCYIRLNGREVVKIKADTNKVWHVSENGKVILEAKLSPNDIKKIEDKLKGVEEINIAWEVDGYGLSESGEFCKISLGSGGKIFRIPWRNFAEKVLDPIGRFKREFIEIAIPTSEVLKKAPPDLKRLVELMSMSKFLVEALKKLSEAKTASDYRSVISEVRSVVERAKTLLNPKDFRHTLAEKLYIELGSFEGEGAIDQANMMINSIYTIFDRVHSMQSGFIKPQTKEQKPKPFEPYPDYYDAYYLTLITVLTLNYLSEKLRKYIEKRR